MVRCHTGTRTRLLPLRLIILFAATLSLCCKRPDPSPSLQASPPDWVLKSTRRMAANELWKEHDGADQIYIERGCISETMRDYRHRVRPWAIRCSIFDQKEPKGARALFDYYSGGIENEIRGIKPVGDAAYFWRSDVMRAWIVGFCRGKYFVEVSLAEEGKASAPMTDAARQALVEFAETLAASL